MDRADLRVTVAHDEEETVVSVSGDLDVSTADQLADTVNEELRDSPGRIVLDLAGLDFCDSLGLGTLVVLSRTARVQQTYLVLRNPSPFFTRMLEVTGVREGLNIAQE
jgi:anti-sigma B factor antagonist